MTDSFEIHGHEVVFGKNEGKAIIEIDLGDHLDECLLVDIFSIDENEYIALLSADSNDIYIFNYADVYTDEDINLTMIEDDDLLDEVYHIFGHYWSDDMIDQLVEEYDLENDLEDDSL